MMGTVRLLRLMVAAALAATLASVAVTSVVVAQDDEAILAEMVALEESKLHPWYQSDVSAYVAEVGPETTWFADSAGTAIKGEAAREWLQGWEGLIPPLDWAITNPAVAVRDDVVVFTYNIDMADPETGDPLGAWMSTKVFERTDDGWALIHGHMSLPAPPPTAEAPAE